MISSCSFEVLSCTAHPPIVPCRARNISRPCPSVARGCGPSTRSAPPNSPVRRASSSPDMSRRFGGAGSPPFGDSIQPEEAEYHESRIETLLPLVLAFVLLFAISAGVARKDLWYCFVSAVFVIFRYFQYLASSILLDIEPGFNTV